MDGNECIHRSLYRRAFQGKTGIYESKGWIPREDTSGMIEIIHNYTKGQAKDLILLLTSINRLKYNHLLEAFEEGDTNLFGTWLERQSCDILIYFYNALLVLSKPGAIKIEISEETKPFLESLYKLRVANGSLYKAPECISSGGIRRVSLSSRRSKNKCRKSRSRKHYRKSSSSHKRN